MEKIFCDEIEEYLNKIYQRQEDLFKENYKKQRRFEKILNEILSKQNLFLKIFRKRNQIQTKQKTNEILTIYWKNNSLNNLQERISSSFKNTQTESTV